MYIIKKEFEFCASHSLNGLKENHPCMNVHGHNYQVIVEFRSPELNSVGMVKDYREMEPIKEWINRTFDHQHLNDRITWMNPTAELLAFHIYKELKSLAYDQLYSVTVKETPKTSATYYED